MKHENLLRGKTIALALSGGGAKGAYQIGMMKALYEAGLDRSKLWLSGTSIGAMNAVYLACHDPETLREMFYAFDRSAGHDTVPVTPFDVVGKAREDVLAGRVTLEEFLNEKRFYAMDPAPLLEYYRETLPDELLEHNSVPVEVCCYSLIARRPVHFRLNGLPAEEQRMLVLASGSLPYVFPPVRYHGDVLLDGGVVPEILFHERKTGHKSGEPDESGRTEKAEMPRLTSVGRAEETPAPHEKIPVPAMCEMLKKENVCADWLIGAFLNLYDEVERPKEGSDSVCRRYRELRPSVPLEESPGSGTLDFSPEKLDSHEKLGYEDTVRFLCSFVSEQAMGTCGY